MIVCANLILHSLFDASMITDSLAKKTSDLRCSSLNSQITFLCELNQIWFLGQLKVVPFDLKISPHSSSRVRRIHVPRMRRNQIVPGSAQLVG